MFTPTLRCECAQPASDRLMRKWCIQTMFLVDDFKIVQFLLFLFTCEWGLGPN